LYKEGTQAMYKKPMLITYSHFYLNFFLSFLFFYFFPFFPYFIYFFYLKNGMESSTCQGHGKLSCQLISKCINTEPKQKGIYPNLQCHQPLNKPTY